MVKWVSTTDRLPANGALTLVWREVPRGRLKLARFRADVQRWVSEPGAWEVSNVTHWAEPPLGPHGGQIGGGMFE